MMPVLSELRRYVALGDSYSAGLPGDEYPPWPELVVEDLRRGSPELALWNLAVEGATTPDVIDDQLPAAIELRPDLVTLVCGPNDLLWSMRPDPDAFRRRLLTAITDLRRAPSPPLVVLATIADVSEFVPFRPRTRARVARSIADFNGVLRNLSADHGCPLVDVERSPHSSDPTSYAPDGLHATRDGHLRMAEATIHTIRGAVVDVEVCR